MKAAVLRRFGIGCAAVGEGVFSNVRQRSFRAAVAAAVAATLLAACGGNHGTNIPSATRGDNGAVRHTMSGGGPTITEYATGSSFGFSSIAPGPDGNMWFAGTGTTMGTITGSGTVNFLPATQNTGEMVTGDDGGMWFSQQFRDGSTDIARMTASGAVTTYTGGTIGANGSLATGGFARGSDAAVWFGERTQTGSDLAIGRITYSGAITEYAVTLPSGDLGSPVAMATGPDNAIWFTVQPRSPSVTSYVGRISTTSTHTITVYALSSTSSLLQKIAKGPDGALWFTDSGTNSIGKITTAGVITEYTVPTASAAPYGIAPGGDGNLWFTEFNTGNVGSITTGGTVTEYTGTASTNGPVEMAQAPDGTVWFAEQTGTNVGHVVMSVTSGRYLVITQNTPTLTVTSGTTATFTCAITIRTYDSVDNYFHLDDWGYGTHISGTGTYPVENYPAVSYLSWAVPDLSATYHAYTNSGAPGQFVWLGSKGQDLSHCIDLQLTAPTTIALGNYNAAITYKTDGSATPSGLATTWGTQTINFKVVVQ